MLVTFYTGDGASYISDLEKHPIITIGSYLSTNSDDPSCFVLADTSSASLESVLQLIRFRKCFIPAQEILKVQDTGHLLGLNLSPASEQVKYKKYVTSDEAGEDIICIEYDSEVLVKSEDRSKKKQEIIYAREEQAMRVQMMRNMKSLRIYK